MQRHREESLMIPVLILAPLPLPCMFLSFRHLFIAAYQYFPSRIHFLGLQNSLPSPFSILVIDIVLYAVGQVRNLRFIWFSLHSPPHVEQLLLLTHGRTAASLSWLHWRGLLDARRSNTAVVEGLARGVLQLQHWSVLKKKKKKWGG